MNSNERVGLYIGRFREGEELRLLSVHKWAKKLRFRELGRNEWGYVGIEKSREMKSCKNQAFRRAAKFCRIAKFRNPCEIWPLSCLKTVPHQKKIPKKQNIKIMNKSIEN